MTKPSKILLIEDNDSLRMLLGHLLSKSYEVETKDNGFEALCWLEQGNIPDLILLDLEMPEMNGEELLQGIKSSGFYKDIPVIIISGNEKNNLQNNSIIDAQDYFEKPFDPVLLKKKIEFILDRNKPQSSSTMNGFIHPM